jgi:hypothetical protein
MMRAKPFMLDCLVTVVAKNPIAHWELMVDQPIIGRWVTLGLVAHRIADQQELKMSVLATDTGGTPPTVVHEGQHFVGAVRFWGRLRFGL